MANAIELVVKYGTKAWDKVYKAEAISSVLDGDKDLIKFTGTKTVKIAKYASSGLSDYRRANNVGGTNFSNGTGVGAGYGYQQGDASVTWEEFTIACDRAIQLRVELFDDEETDGLAVAMATAETSRTKVVPEVDAYVFSKLAELAGTVREKNITPTTSNAGIGDQGNPIWELNKAFETLADLEVPENDQVIFCSNAFYNALRNTGEIVKTLRQTEYKENVKFTIGEYEGREIIAVPATRFRTLINLHDNGYGWKSGSRDINFIVCAKSAVYHITKYDKVRVFSPAVVQDYDGYKINVRIYHDVFVPDNKRVALYACVKESASGITEVAHDISFVYDADKSMLTSIAVLPADTLVDTLYLAQSAPAIGSEVGSVTKIYPYKALTGATGKYIVAGCDGKVVAVSGKTIA